MVAHFLISFLDYSTPKESDNWRHQMTSIQIEADCLRGFKNPYHLSSLFMNLSSPKLRWQARDDANTPPTTSDLISARQTYICNSNPCSIYAIDDEINIHPHKSQTKWYNDLRQDWHPTLLTTWIPALSRHSFTIEWPCVMLHFRLIDPPLNWSSRLIPLYNDGLWKITDLMIRMIALFLRRIGSRLHTR